MNSVILFLMLSCQRGLSERDEFELECINIFEDILEIQDQREYFNNNMQYISKLRRERSISKKKYKSISSEWIKKETYLRDKVTKLYDKAYSDGCFERRPDSLGEK